MSVAAPRVARGPDTGVTLIEMLVSLVIFAIVGVASFTMIDTLLQVRARTEGRLEAVARIDRALFVFARDVAQGDPATLRVDDTTLDILFSRDRRHSYVIDDGTLTRSIEARATSAPPLTQRLAEDVREVTFDVLDGARIWQSSWPPADVEARARAVHVVLTLEDGRTIERLVRLTDAGPP